MCQDHKVFYIYLLIPVSHMHTFHLQPGSLGLMLVLPPMLRRTLVTVVRWVSRNLITGCRKQDLLSVYTYSTCTHGSVHTSSCLN